MCRAVADALEARFNPVAVRGEISGFSRASSGHCYFSIKDGQGQIRCAMFRRAAMLLDGIPRDGEMVELRGRLAVYEARGDLQLIVESLQRAGQGALFEQFLRLKARLESEGLFDPARKRSLPVMPRSIGLVTSPGAAALHDVVTPCGGAFRTCRWYWPRPWCRGQPRLPRSAPPCARSTAWPNRPAAVKGARPWR